VLKDYPTESVKLLRNPYFISVVYLVLITGAELLTIKDPKIGIAFHVIILFILLFHAGLESDRDERLSRFLMALLIAPLIRILSLALPYVRFDLIHWFAVISIPIFIAILTGMWLQGLHLKDIGLPIPKLVPRNIPLEISMLLIAVPVGIAEYFILKPNPLPGLERTDIIIGMLIFIICTGFLEEMAFRGLLQYNAVRLMSKWNGILVLSAFFGVLHLGNISPWNLDCVLAFSIGFLYSAVREKVGSIYAISLSHGIINITLFFLAPLYF
jgi:membrane protease YdiL (CAAX protease family)